MKENILSIIINAPIEVVFEYTTNPENTHQWIKTMQKEEVNQYPIKIGTEYRNTNNGKDWTTYAVTVFELNKIFELQEKGGSYFVRYVYEDLGNNKTKMTYHEWDRNGLSNPFAQDVLENLKVTLEIDYYKNQFKLEFPFVYEWVDKPGTIYPEHSHQGRVSLYIVSGSVSFSGGLEKTLIAGDRFDVPVGVEHTAVVGPQGCEYVVGEEIEGDS